MVDQSSGTALITVSRTLTTGTSTVNFATADGTAVAGTDYTADLRHAVVQPRRRDPDVHRSRSSTRTRPEASRPSTSPCRTRPGASSTSSPPPCSGSSTMDRGRRGFSPSPTPLDSGPGSLRQAILYANARLGPMTSPSTSRPQPTPFSTSLCPDSIPRRKTGPSRSALPCPP